MGVNPHRAPTIIDIAREADVSKTTVSRVLNGSPLVASETRARVLEAISQLGFQVNQAARSLRTSRSGLVGFLVPIISIFGLIVEELDHDLADEGISILLTSSRRREPERDLDALETLVGRGVDALILAPSDDRSTALAAFLRSVRTPVVLLDREVRGLRCDSVLIDQGPAIDGALRHFVELGHRRIGLLTRDRKTRPGREIIDRFHEACIRHDTDTRPELIVEYEDLDHQAGRDGVDRLLETGVDAILASGTMTHTTGILERLGQRGVRVPHDVALAVYGAYGAGSEFTGLPTVAYPIEEIARATGRLLLTRLASPTAPPRVEVVQTTFVNPRGPVPDTVTAT